jgi:hypothetical protein
MAVPPEEAKRRCRHALMEAWVERESAVFKLPSSRLVLYPCDAVLLDHDGRQTEFRPGVPRLARPVLASPSWPRPS